MKTTVTALGLLALVAGVACSTPQALPAPAAIVGEDGHVTTPLLPENLTTAGLLPPYPACCPGAECCAAPHFCAYFDTADPSLGDAGAGLTSTSGLRLAGTSPKAGVGAACKGVNDTAFAAPQALAVVLSYDSTMDLDQGWAVLGLAEWLVAAARAGIGDFATTGSLSNGMGGAVARQPLWTRDGWRWWDVLHAFPTYTVNCAQRDYEAASSPLYALAGEGSTMMATLPDPYFGDDFTEMGPENPVIIGWRAAKKRLHEYWGSAPDGKITTLAVALLVRGEATEHCGPGSGMAGLQAAALDAVRQPPAGMPPTYTHVIGYDQSTHGNSEYGKVRTSGFGAMYPTWSGARRQATKDGLSFLRKYDQTRAFYIHPPANGEEINDASLRFFVALDGRESLLENRASLGGCFETGGTARRGYWLTRPEGPTKRVLLSLCPLSAEDAANAMNPQATSARVVYDCVEQFPASATFVRDFDLSRCGSSDTPTTRALRLDWTTSYPRPLDEYVTFVLRFAPTIPDLATAPEAGRATASARAPASWKTFVDLTDASRWTLPRNYRAARLEAKVVASQDRTRSPTIDDWKLTFTCIDGS